MPLPKTALEVSFVWYVSGIKVELAAAEGDERADEEEAAEEVDEVDDVAEVVDNEVGGTCTPLAPVSKKISM